MVILLRHSHRQHLLVQKQSAQTFLAGLSLLFQLPLPEGFLLKLALLGTFLKDRREISQRGHQDEDQGIEVINFDYLFKKLNLDLNDSDLEISCFTVQDQ